MRNIPSGPLGSSHEKESTFEPVFGSLAQYYGLNKIGVLGKAGVHKVMLLAAIAFNLKKYLKKGEKKLSWPYFKDVVKDLEQALFASPAFLNYTYQFC